MGFLSVLTLIFIVLKLTAVIAWSWWWVLSPMLLIAAIVLLIMALAVIAEIVK